MEEEKPGVEIVLELLAQIKYMVGFEEIRREYGKEDGYDDERCGHIDFPGLLPIEHIFNGDIQDRIVEQKAETDSFIGQEKVGRIIGSQEVGLSQEYVYE